MAKICIEHETPYEIGDVIIFAKHNFDNWFSVGVIKDYCFDCDSFWFDVQLTKEDSCDRNTYGDVAEWEIFGKIENKEDADKIRNIILTTKLNEV